MSKKAFAVVLVLSLLFSAAVMSQPNNLVSANYIPYLPNAFSASYLASVSSSAGWNQTYGGADSDSAESVIQTIDGGYALAGYTASGAWLVKTDSLGNVEWTRTYGGADAAESVIQTIDGGYALAGYTASGAWLVKTDSAGNMQWNRTYGGQAASCIIQTSDGGYALAGSDFWLVKTDALGNMQWNKTYGGGIDRAESVIQTSDGGYAVIGTTTPGAGEGDFLLVKTDSAGDMEWSKTYGSIDKDEGFSVVQAGDGGYALGGWMWSRDSGGGPNICLVKTDSIGDTQWKRTYGGGIAWSMVQTSDGGYAIGGFVGEDAELVKTDSEGNVQWTKVYEGSGGILEPNSIIQTSDEGYAMAGLVLFPEMIDGIGTVSSDAWLLKTDSEGNYNPSITEPFPTTLIMASVASVAVVGVGLLVYFRKRKH